MGGLEYYMSLGFRGSKWKIIRKHHTELTHPSGWWFFIFEVTVVSISGGIPEWWIVKVVLEEGVDYGRLVVF
jgi:hydrogenase maturation factor